MKLLWITNILYPEVESILKNENSDLKTSGGWMTSLADALIANQPDIDLRIATVSNIVSESRFVKGKNYNYYIIPYGKGNLSYNKSYEKEWIKIKNDFNPDIVHIHGTEFTHGLAYVNSCGTDNVIVSIQGIISEIAKKYLGEIKYIDCLKSTTIKDVLSGHSMLALKGLYAKRGKYEIELLQKVKYICGRTEWDKATTYAINPRLKYFHCGELIRDEFYSGCWNENTCKRYNVFVSQSHYPLKGLHKVIEAINILHRDFPNIVLNVAGNNICCNETCGDKLRLSGYGYFILKLLKKYGLKENTRFIGYLNAKEMKEEYLKCNVFVCASSLENSPNSIAEAQMLGVPVVASFVGGIPDMIPSNDVGLMYPFSDVNALAYSIKKVFESKSGLDLCNMRELARKRHDKFNVCSDLLNAYKMILNNINT